MTEPKFKLLATVPWRFIYADGTEIVVPAGGNVTGEQYFEFMRRGAPLKELTGPREIEIEEPERTRHWTERKLAEIQARERDR